MLQLSYGGAGHVARLNEPANKVVLWEPDASRKVGQPNSTLKKVLEEDTGLEGKDLRAVMLESLLENELCHSTDWHRMKIFLSI